MTDGDAPPTGLGAVADGRESWQPAVVSSVTRLTSRVVSIVLRPERWRSFLAGQHIDVRLTAPDGYHAQRSYSVASPPAREGLLELVVERLDDGEVSPYFHDGVLAGDAIEIRGPFAEHFVWRPDARGAVLLAAGGSGVAPFLAMVRQRAVAPNPGGMLLLYSARHWEDIILRDELLTQEREQNGLHVVFCLTRGEAHRAMDFAHRVDENVVAACLSRLGALPEATFVCGSNAFVGRVADLLLGAGIPRETIRTERYGGT